MAQTILNHLFQWNGDIFKDIVIPAGMDKDDMSTAIFQRCYKLPVIYPEWEIMKKFSDAWFKRHLKDFERLWAVYTAEYSLTDDYDMVVEYGESSSKTGTMSSRSTGELKGNRTENGENSSQESETTKIDRKNEGTKTSGNTRTVSGSVTDKGTETTATTTSGMDMVAPYNASTYVNNTKADGTSDTDFTRNMVKTTSDKIVDDGNVTENYISSDTGSKTGSASGTEKNTSTYQETKNGTSNSTSDETGTKDGNRHEHGHKESPLELLAKERNFAKWNAYEHIAELWEREFCITVY